MEIQNEFLRSGVVAAQGSRWHFIIERVFTLRSRGGTGVVVALYRNDDFITFRTTTAQLGQLYTRVGNLEMSGMEGDVSTKQMRQMFDETNV